MKPFFLEIITPEKIAYSGEVEMVVAPSALGAIGILHGHVPLLARLIEGELKITKGTEEIFFAIGGGFIEVDSKKVTILVTSAYHADEINEQEVLKARQRAEEALAAKPSGINLIKAQSLFRESLIAMKVLQRKRKKSSFSASSQ